MNDFDDQYWDDDYYRKNVKNEPFSKPHLNLGRSLIFLGFLIPGILLMMVFPPLGIGLILLGEHVAKG